MAQDRKEWLASIFSDRFGRPPAWIGEAPGRVNLIGEHTDYNDGFVLPAAIDRTALVAVASAAGSLGRVWSANLDEEGVLDGRGPSRWHSWIDYVRGVAWALLEAGHPVGRVDVTIHSDVPMGAGLGSSAALEVAGAAALAATAGAVLPALDLARLAHRAETDFVGVPCGIMDQFVSSLAREDHALLIDCRAESAEPVALGLEEQGIALVVVDSGVRRELARSAYRERREECEEVVRRLGPLLPQTVSKLRDVAPEDLDVLGDRLPEVSLRRARHVVSENARVLRCVDALRERRLEEVASLLARSHRSLRDDYQVSCPELDLLAELAWSTPGVVGARLTGAGFGGCTVNLVRADALARFERQVVVEYRRRTGRAARAYRCRAAGGATVTAV